MTCSFASSFGGSVGNADDRGLYVILSASEISHRTIALLVVIARHEVPRQSVGIMVGVYVAYFFRGIATLTLAMTRKFNRHCAKTKTAGQV